MKETKVINPKNLPTRAPVLLTFIAFMAFHEYKWPDWFMGVSATLIALLWIAFIISTIKEKYVSLRELE